MFYITPKSNNQTSSETEYQKQVLLASNYWVNYQSLNFAHMFILETFNLWIQNAEIEKQEFSILLEKIDNQYKQELSSLQSSLQQYYSVQNSANEIININDLRHKGVDQSSSSLSPLDINRINKYIESLTEVLQERQVQYQHKVNIIIQQQNYLDRSFKRENNQLQTAGFVLNQVLSHPIETQDKELISDLMSVISHHETDMVKKLHMNHTLVGDLRLKRQLMALDREEGKFLIQMKKRLTEGNITDSKESIQKEIQQFRIDMIKKREQAINDHYKEKHVHKGNMQQDMIRLEIYQKDRQQMCNGNILFDQNDTIEVDLEKRLRSHSKARFHNPIAKLEKMNANKRKRIQRRIDNSIDQQSVEINPNAPQPPPLLESIPEVVETVMRKKLNKQIDHVVHDATELTVDVASQLDTPLTPSDDVNNYSKQRSRSPSMYVDACTGVVSDLLTQSHLERMSHHTGDDPLRVNILRVRK